MVEVLQHIKFPARYDPDGQIIVDSDGKPIVEVRGYGWIYQLGQYDHHADKMQDELGEAICRKINELEQEKSI